MFDHMKKQILIQLDEAIAAELERYAPAKSRQRSEFIRLAIRKALMDVRELETAQAYREQPDDDPVAFDPRTWDAEAWSAPPRASRRR